MHTNPKLTLAYFEENYPEFASRFYETYRNAPRREQERLEHQAATGSQRGRRPVYSAPMKQRGVMLTQEQIDVATQLGGGNFSEGVRRALDRVIPGEDLA